MSGKVLLVEDEELVGTMVRINLEAEGFEVQWAKDGDAGLAAAADGSFDLVLLDISLPGTDGIGVLGELRRREIGTPVLMLTARVDVPTKVQTLDLGADDYVTKPFDMAELTARVRALVRRSQADREIPSTNVASFGAYEVNFETREARSNEGSVSLTEKEAALLRLLVRARGQALTRADILDEVWGMDATPSERTVDNVILRLRKLFEPDPEQPRHIVTVRGTGYMFSG